jgi:hypothetical protein
LNQFQRALTCITLLAVTAFIGVGALTTVAVKLQLVTPSAALCKAKFWVHQECGITARNTESETVTENGSAMEDIAQRLPENVQAEQTRENSTPAAAQQETAVKETHYNVASAQAALPESAAVLATPAAVAAGTEPLQSFATDAPPSKQPIARRVTKQPNRNALGTRNNQQKSKLVTRETLRDVSVNSSDGMQRRIDIHPTSLQDVYYYSAPR